MRSAELTRTCMVRMFTIVFLFFSVVVVNAQQIAVSSPAYQEFNNVPASPLLRKNSVMENNFMPFKSTFRIPGERQKKFGSTMAILGGAMIVGGIVLYSGSDKTPSKDSVLNNYNQWEVYNVYDAKLVGGILLMVVGTGVTVPGILIWRGGVRKYNQYMIQQENLSFYFRGTGASVRYRF